MKAKRKTATKPSNSCTWCWWCCHPFESPPLGMPLSYDARADTFDVYGAFCSFPCMKAYNHNEHSANKMSQYSLISLLISKTCKGNVVGGEVTCAPPRQMLNVFGGPLTIQEFRDTFTKDITYELNPPNTIRVNHGIEKQSKSNFKWIKSSDDTSERCYSIKDFEQKAASDRVTNHALKIKPHNDKNPQKTINTLENVLGIFPNTH